VHWIVSALALVRLPGGQTKLTEPQVGALQHVRSLQVPSTQLGLFERGVHPGLQVYVEHFGGVAIGEDVGAGVVTLLQHLEIEHSEMRFCGHFVSVLTVA